MLQGVVLIRQRLDYFLSFNRVGRDHEKYDQVLKVSRQRHTEKSLKEGLNTRFTSVRQATLIKGLLRM